MSRWAVRKLHPHVCGPDGTAWVAGEVGKWHNTVCSFPTHAEALAYADRKARTREVVLPRVNGFTPIDENDLDISVFDVAGSVCISQPQLGRSGKEQIITIHTESAAEVALALLAHAERIAK